MNCCYKHSNENVTLDLNPKDFLFDNCISCIDNFTADIGIVVRCKSEQNRNMKIAETSFWIHWSTAHSSLWRVVVVWPIHYHPGNTISLSRAIEFKCSLFVFKPHHVICCPKTHHPPWYSVVYKMFADHNQIIMLHIIVRNTQHSIIYTHSIHTKCTSG